MSQHEALDVARLIFNSVVDGCFTLVIIPVIVVLTLRYMRTEPEKRS